MGIEDLGTFRVRLSEKSLVNSLFGIAYVLGLVLARSIGLQSVREIRFDDETIYLDHGIRMFLDGAVPAERSPLYQLWYWLQSLIINDPVDLYYCNWSALLFINLLVLWFLLTKMRVPRVRSVVLLALFSTLTLFEVWPYVTLLSMAGVGIAMRLTFGLRSWINTLSTLSALFGILAFVRPELTTSFLLSVLTLVCVSWFENGTIARKGGAFVISVVPFLSLLVIFGSPFGGNRLFHAFGQHYSVNVVQTESLQVDPWNSHAEIWRRDFGDSDSVWDALRTNPKRVAWHVRANVRNLTSAWDIFTPAVASPRLRTTLGLLVVAGVLLGGVVGLRTMYARGARTFWTDHSPESHALIATAFLAVPSLGSMVLVYPRAHYLLAPCLGVVVFSASGLSELLSKAGLRGRDRWQGVAAVGLGCLVVLPGSSGLEPWYLRRTVLATELKEYIKEHVLGRSGHRATSSSGPEHLESIATIRFLQGLPLSIAPGESIGVLEADYSRAVYAGWPQFHRINQTQCRPFIECIRRERPEIIVNNLRLRKYYSMLNDDGYKTFLMRPETLGYKRMEIPGQQAQIFVREDIIGQPADR
jgi:hypothetical protein